jgi:hypothetical protein
MILDDFDDSAVVAAVIYHHDSSRPDFLSGRLITLASNRHV